MSNFFTTLGLFVCPMNAPAFAGVDKTISRGYRTQAATVLQSFPSRNSLLCCKDTLTEAQSLSPGSPEVPLPTSFHLWKVPLWL